MKGHPSPTILNDFFSKNRSFDAGILNDRHWDDICLRSGEQIDGFYPPVALRNLPVSDRPNCRRLG